MKMNTNQSSLHFKRFLLLIFPIWLASCSVEKRVYQNGYHITWEKRVQLPKSTFKKFDLKNNTETETNLSIELDNEKHYNHPSEKTAMDTVPDKKVTPEIQKTTRKEKKLQREKTPGSIEYGKIKKINTVKDLKNSVKYDLKKSLVAAIGYGICAAVLYLFNFYLVAPEFLFVLFALASIAYMVTFGIHFLRGTIRLTKLGHLKMLKVPDDAYPRKPGKNDRLNDSNRQYFKRFFRWLINFIFRPKSFGQKVIFYLVFFAIAMGIVSIRH